MLFDWTRGFQNACDMEKHTDAVPDLCVGQQYSPGALRLHPCACVCASVCYLYMYIRFLCMYEYVYYCIYKYIYISIHTYMYVHIQMHAVCVKHFAVLPARTRK